MKDLDVLRTSKLLEGFTDEEMAALHPLMEVRNYDDGHVFIHEGEPSGDLYFVLSGTVHVTRRKPDGPGVDDMSELGPGNFFGETALVDQGPRTATCTADGPTRVASLAKSGFQFLYRTSSPVAHKFQFAVARQLARHVRVLNEHVLELALADPSRQ